jgi:hypothetical protein
VDEVSNDWNRCCCAPHHPLKLEVRQHVPMPGEGVNGNEGAIIMNEARSEYQALANSGGNLRDSMEKLNELYQAQPVAMTMVRVLTNRLSGAVMPFLKWPQWV